MYYAKRNGVGQGEVPESGATLTAEEYLGALERIAGGERVAVIDGAVTFYRPPVYLVDAEGFCAGAEDELPEGAPLILDAPDPALVKPKRVDGAWVEGETPAERIKRLLPEVKAVRDRREQSTFTYNGWRFDADPVSVARINGVSIAAQTAISAGQPFSISWTDADNQDRLLDAQDVLAMQQALVAHADACHQFAKQVAADVEAGLITTKAEIEAQEWPE